MPSNSRITTNRFVTIATRQHGVVTRSQLLAAGIPGRAIDGRIANGWLLPAHRGVYAIGRPVSAEAAVRMAGLLAAGTSAALARRSAARHWDLLQWKGRVEILRPESRKPPRFLLHPPGVSRRREVEVLRSATLEASDISRQGRTLVTSVARTLLDLAGILGERELRAAFNEADRRGLLDDVDLDTWVARAKRQRGAPGFKRLAEARNPSIGRTRSELEAIFLALCRRHGIPDPAVNQRLLGLEVDCLWLEQGLVVELDGFEFHRGRMASINDAVRDSKLMRSGYRVLRLNYDLVVNRPEEAVELVGLSLAEDSRGRSSRRFGDDRPENSHGRGGTSGSPRSYVW